MTDQRKDEWTEDKDAALLDQLEQLADRLDGQRYPGRAWSPERAQRHHTYRLAWRIAAHAGAIAATVLVAVLLHRTAPRQVPQTMTGVPEPIVPVSPASPMANSSLPDVSAVLDVSLVARTDLQPREVDLSVPAVPATPSIARVGRLESYSWKIPELRLAGL